MMQNQVQIAIMSLQIFILLLTVSSVWCQCPWPNNMTDLKSGCLCAFSVGQQLSLQCSHIQYNRLIEGLQYSNTGTILVDLLYINNSTLPELTDGMFESLRLSNVQLSNCGIRNVSTKAFDGQEDFLISLHLQDNEIIEIPSDALRSLKQLKQLDLSRNKISLVPQDAFAGLLLQRLKITDNHLELSDGSFVGLEKTLKNLNLKGTGQSTVPKALQNLTSLAFLDLAQNQISTIIPGIFQNLNSLTALNLERNPIKILEKNAFLGIQDTLSSLSLLNNLIVEFPTEALALLTELRVLDIGFNRIKLIPKDAFKTMTSLTLLAMDGNPLVTIPSEPFHHLNETMRGLSIGGRSLECDCNLRWISEWVRDYDLQVTSRERNPQFCGKPPELRPRNFPQIHPNELKCENETEETTLETLTVDSSDQDSGTELNSAVSLSGLSTESPLQPPYLTRSQSPRMDNSDRLDDILVKDAFRQNSSIVIHWDVKTLTTSGFRVLYRLFGEDKFKFSSPLQVQERKFQIHNVPINECFVVCVVNLEYSYGSDISADSVPLRNCREVRSERTETSEMDKIIIIAASAAICGAVIVAVIIFVCCNRQRMQREHRQLPMAPITAIPVLETVKAEWDNVSVYSSRSIPRARMYHGEKSGGTVNSAYLHDDALTHMSHASASKHNGYLKGRTLADGQSQRSYSAMSAHHLGYSSLRNSHLNHYPMGRPEINQSIKSIAHSTMTGGLYKKKSKHPRSAMSSIASFHSLNEFENENPALFKPDKWTDHDIDIYMARNHTSMGQPEYR